MPKSLKDLQAVFAKADLVGFERGSAVSQIKVGATKTGATKGDSLPVSN